MHAEGIVTRILGPCLTGMHLKRAAALTRAIAAVLRGGTVSLSAVALHLGPGIALKHRLKSVDRLLGNPALQRVRHDLYRPACATVAPKRQTMVDRRRLVGRDGGSALAVAARQCRGRGALGAAL